MRILVWLCCACLALSGEPQFKIRTIAGSNYVGDGASAVAAALIQPEGMAFDAAGNLYIADAGDHRVRRISSQGIITTLAGTGIAGMRGDGGPAVSAELNAPYDVAVDRSGNVLIADLGNARIRRVTPSGTIETVVGASSGNTLKQPRNIAIDSQGNLFISDFGDHRIYRVERADTLTVVAGTGEAGYTGDNGPANRAQLTHPAGLAIDASDVLYAADSGNRRIRRISGGLIQTFVDRDRKPVEFGTPTSIAIDRSGRIYVTDGGGTITALSTLGEVSSIPHAGSSIALDANGRLYFTTLRQVRRWDNNLLAIIAGSVSGYSAGDGRPQAEWRFHSPSGLARDSAGDLYIADWGNGRVRRVTASGELQSVVVGLGGPTGLARDGSGRLWIADGKNGVIFRWDGNGPARSVSSGNSSKPFRSPNGLALDASGNLYVADTGNNLVRRVTPDGTVTTIAGGGGLDEDTLGVRMRLDRPWGLAFDAYGNLWFTEAAQSRLRKLTPSGYVSTLKIVGLEEPRGLSIGLDGCFYLADYGLQQLIKITPDGKWWPLAGNGDAGFSGDGESALASSLNGPLDIFLERDGRILFTDSGNGRVRELIPQNEPEQPQPPAQIIRPEFEVLHAATRKVQPVAPGQLVQLVMIAANQKFPSQPKVQLNGLPVRVLTANDNQITAQIPIAFVVGRAEVSVEAQGARLMGGIIDVGPVAPGLLAATNEDGALNSSENAAARGSIVTLYLTGEGVDPHPVVEVEIGGYTSEVLYAGRAPALPGVFQINVRTPTGFAPTGVLALDMRVSGVSAQSGLTIATR